MLNTRAEMVDASKAGNVTNSSHFQSAPINMNVQYVEQPQFPFVSGSYDFSGKFNIPRSLKHHLDMEEPMSRKRRRVDRVSDRLQRFSLDNENPLPESSSSSSGEEEGMANNECENPMTVEEPDSDEDRDWKKMRFSDNLKKYLAESRNKELDQIMFPHKAAQSSQLPNTGFVRPDALVPYQSPQYCHVPNGSGVHIQEIVGHHSSDYVAHCDRPLVSFPNEEPESPTSDDSEIGTDVSSGRRSLTLSPPRIEELQDSSDDDVEMMEF